MIIIKTNVNKQSVWKPDARKYLAKMRKKLKLKEEKEKEDKKIIKNLNDLKLKKD